MGGTPLVAQWWGIHAGKAGNPLPDHAGDSSLLSRSGGEKGLRGSGAGTLGVPLASRGPSPLP